MTALIAGAPDEARDQNSRAAEAVPTLLSKAAPVAVLHQMRLQREPAVEKRRQKSKSDNEATRRATGLFPATPPLTGFAMPRTLFPLRAAATFAGGALIAFVGARLLPPLVAQARGRARSRNGGDPLETLVADHRAIMSHLDAMVDSADGEAFSRTQHLLRLKRRLGAHAMAEEDIVYPALREQAGLENDATQLYQEHAQMKVLLYKLEQTPKTSEQWHDHATALRTLIEEHVRQEEDEDFPKLRAALDDIAASELGAKIEREKALVL